MATTTPIDKIPGVEIKIIVRTFKDLFHKVSVLIIITIRTKTGIIGNILGGIKIPTLESIDTTTTFDGSDTVVTTFTSGNICKNPKCEHIQIHLPRLCPNKNQNL